MLKKRTPAEVANIEICEVERGVPTLVEEVEQATMRVGVSSEIMEKNTGESDMIFFVILFRRIETL